MGVPVVTTRVAALPEVLGDAALMVDGEREALADGLARAVADRELRRVLIERGHQRVAGYSWARSAAQMRELYGAASTGL